MPRLTTQQYLIMRQWLRDLWHYDQAAFQQLPLSQRQLLERFFAYHDNLTTRQVRLHRKVVSAKTPKLPYQAGKALAQLRRLQSPMQHEQQKVVASTGRRQVRVRGVRKKQIDTDKVALAFLLLAKDLAARERGETPTDPEDKPAPPDSEGLS